MQLVTLLCPLLTTLGQAGSKRIGKESAHCHEKLEERQKKWTLSRWASASFYRAGHVRHPTSPTQTCHPGSPGSGGPCHPTLAYTSGRDGGLRHPPSLLSPTSPSSSTRSLPCRPATSSSFSRSHSLIIFSLYFSHCIPYFWKQQCQQPATPRYFGIFRPKN